jgi:hypothetical protein
MAIAGPIGIEATPAVPPGLRIHAIAYANAYAVNLSAIGSATPLLLIRTTM